VRFRGSNGAGGNPLAARAARLAEAHFPKAINQALMRKQINILRKSKNYDETFLTEPTSLEMFSTVINSGSAESVVKKFAEIASHQGQRVTEYARHARSRPGMRFCPAPGFNRKREDHDLAFREAK
jgi:hypothetical protein